MTTSGLKKALIFAYMGIFSLITPVGIAIGIVLIESKKGSENELLQCHEEITMLMPSQT